MYKQFVDFHGELLLLVHWSILAYTGLVKILKKHHKRTGLLVKAPHLDNLLSQPFCSVEVSVRSKQCARLRSTLLSGEWLAGGCLSPFAMWRLSWEPAFLVRLQCLEAPLMRILSSMPLLELHQDALHC